MNSKINMKEETRKKEKNDSKENKIRGDNDKPGTVIDT